MAKEKRFLKDGGKRHKGIFYTVYDYAGNEDLTIARVFGKQKRKFWVISKR